ncbi:hypothetical protein LDENG_00158590 [Lucifuga dentata]|nr:hypothetical protein LDENG_00158590 [Lucifuga dentata]
MTVRFKCQTEYQRSFGVSWWKSASPQHRVPLAGMTGISRESRLQRRRRFGHDPDPGPDAGPDPGPDPHPDPGPGPGPACSLLCSSDQQLSLSEPPPAQRTVPPSALMSCSAQKKVPILDPKPPTPPKPPTDPTELRLASEPGPPAKPEPPSDLAKPRPFLPDSQPQRSSPATVAADGQQSSTNEVNHVMQWKAGLRSGSQRSEYHRQFNWKKPANAASPILTAEQVLFSSSKSVPPFKKIPVTMETEYQMSFQGLIPPTGPHLQKHLGHQRVPLFYTHMSHKKSREESEKKLHLIPEDPAPQKENVRSQSRTQKAITMPPPPPPPQRVQHRIQEGGTADEDALQVSEPAVQSRSWLNEVTLYVCLCFLGRGVLPITMATTYYANNNNLEQSL